MQTKPTTALTAQVRGQLKRRTLRSHSTRGLFSSGATLSQQIAQASASDDVDSTDAAVLEAPYRLRFRRPRAEGVDEHDTGAPTGPNNITFLASSARISPPRSGSGPSSAITQSKVTWSPQRRTTDIRLEDHHKDAKVEDNKIYVRERSGGKPHWSEVPGRWLRDHCTCNECRDPNTAQRKMNVLSGGIDCSVSSVEQFDFGRRARVTFGDGHENVFNLSRIANRNWPVVVHLRQGEITTQLWKNSISGSPPIVTYKSITSGGNNGIRKLLQKVRQYGFSFVDHVPPTPEATEKILNMIGPIRNTHYGGFYDFTNDLSSKDTAYTAEALEPHTDTTYFTEPIGLQALHLLSHSHGEGGRSSLVDGFAVASALFESDLKAYLVLSKVGVYAHASGNEGISIQSQDAYPTFLHDSSLGHLTQVRWNNADRAALKRLPWSLTDEWYDAASKFDKLIQSKEYQYWFQLQPGRLLIFDNWRVLHGRSAFTGKRRMCGGYINRDDWISKLRMTSLNKEQIEASTVSG